MLLKDKVALITAGASGMGRAAAELFAREGAHVIVVDVNAEAAKETVTAIEAEGGSATSSVVDVRDLGALKALAEQVTAEHGALHVLFNNVGIPGAAGLDLTEEEWNTGLEINARASFFLSGYLTDALKAAGNASVIFTSSTSGLIGSPYSPMYSFTKGGVIALVRSMALAFATEGIRVNAIAPGSVETPGLPAFFRIDDPEEIEKRKQAFFATIPMGRAADPSEIAKVALFLASDLSSYVTGVTIPVDGGITAK
ncbi:SDR family oxidoreductase [Planosporangium thailandense]|uniref:SDR family oxidoreductase n=1 Tax=Planosporangium thailandense TaxID=765197 RepID=A0ABX0Y0M1_9ACTN|nr:SDR family NAD(P)-dependent oxidoreductase [Planosporangium thailandense]NJC71895.1 SDR family oxidoreductase [Planosporangium thailandense]